MAICAPDFTLPDFRKDCAPRMTFTYHSGDLVTFFTYVVEFQDNWIPFTAIYARVLTEILGKAHVQSDQNLLFACGGSCYIRRLFCS